MSHAPKHPPLEVETVPSHEDLKRIEKDQAAQDRAFQLKADRERTENPPLDPNENGQADRDRSAERARIAAEKVIADAKAKTR